MFSTIHTCAVYPPKTFPLGGPCSALIIFHHKVDGVGVHNDTTKHSDLVSETYLVLWIQTPVIVIIFGGSVYVYSMVGSYE